MLKIGMIGAGFVASFHERALCSVRGVELAGVYALKGAEDLAKRASLDGLGKTKIYKNIAELCQAVDVICLFAPNFARIQIMQDIAQAVNDGAKLKGIICEKPLAKNLAEANTLVNTAKKLGVPTAYFENQIHMPGVVEARRQLAAVADLPQPHVQKRPNLWNSQRRCILFSPAVSPKSKTIVR